MTLKRSMNYNLRIVKIRSINNNHLMHNSLCMKEKMRINIFSSAGLQIPPLPPFFFLSSPPANLSCPASILPLHPAGILHLSANHCTQVDGSPVAPTAKNRGPREHVQGLRRERLVNRSEYLLQTFWWDGQSFSAKYSCRLYLKTEWKYQNECISIGQKQHTLKFPKNGH